MIDANQPERAEVENEEVKKCDLAKKTAASESQQAIIEYPVNGGEILSVRAGPGSGKTWTLSKRVEYLINNGMVQPEELVVLSMTNRAVSSLKNTLGRLIGVGKTNQIEVGTFHSFCANLVDQHHEKYCPSRAHIRRRLMDDTSWRMFFDIFSGKTIEINGKTIRGKLTSLTLEKVLNEIKNGQYDIEFAAHKYNVSNEYLEQLLNYLKESGLMRYQDFITEALDIIDESLARRDLIPSLNNYKMIIVDEFQDMHRSLASVIRGVVSYPTGPENGLKHLTIAGDQHQCIYEFLGASPDIDVAKEFPGFKVTELPIRETFRLTPQILGVSEKILENSGLKRPGDQSIVSTRKPLYPPVIFTSSSSDQENRAVMKEITRLILESGGLLKPADIAVLARTNVDLEQFQRCAQEHGFKCNKFSSNAEWVKSKVHLLLDIMNVMSQGAGSDLNLLCILLLLDKRVGSRLRVAKLFNVFDQWKAAHHSLYTNNAMEEFLWHQFANRDKKPAKSLFSIYKPRDHQNTLHLFEAFLTSIRQEREYSATNDNPNGIIESLLRVVTRSGLVETMNLPSHRKLSHLSLEEQITEHKLKLEANLKAFFQTLKGSYHKYILMGSSEDSFLQYFMKSYNEDVTIVDNDMINVSTIHMAKGLEFPVVFLLGNSQSNYNSNTEWVGVFDEEAKLANHSIARLFYVACTRSRSLLYVGSSPMSTTRKSNVHSMFTDAVPPLTPIIDEISWDLNRQPPKVSKMRQGSNLFNGMFVAPRNIALFSKRRFSSKPSIWNQKSWHSSITRSCETVTHRKEILQGIRLVLRK